MARKGEPRAKSAVPAVEKALDVIELLADSPHGMTMNDIVAALDRTMGEIYRVVVYLADREYLEQDGSTGCYRLTLKLFEISHRYNPTERLISAAIPLLERVAANTQQSCHLGVLNRTNVLVLASVTSPHPAGYAVRTGALFPVRDTSSGHVILAFSKVDAQKRFLARLSGVEKEETRHRLDRIAEDGFEDTASRMVMGVRNLCVPVFDARGIVAALTCGFIERANPKVSPGDTLAALREGAGELSAKLGHIT